MKYSPHIKLNDDLFLINIPDEQDTHLLYAPLRRRATKVTTKEIDDVVTNTEHGSSILLANGFSISQWRFPDPPADTYYSPFNFGSVMLSITSQCNLRCAYCFADGGDYHTTMPWNIVQAFLDFVPGAARRNGNRYSVSFHGDGEAFMAQPLMFKICTELKELGKKHNFTINTSVTTNATLIDENNIHLVKEHLNTVGVSFDGDELAQNTNRPHNAGVGSFPMVKRAVDLLKKNGINFSLRATITKDTVTRMPEMIDFIVDVIKGTSIHFEPATACNRAGESMVPEANLFIEYFRKAKKRAEERGITIFTASCRPDNLSQMFCGASSPGMTILADGTITSCSRVTHPEDPFIDKYRIATFNDRLQTFEFLPDTISKLRKETIVTAYPECDDCFARWHCSGICTANRDRNSTPLLCEITQHLLVAELNDKYSKNGFLNQQEAIKKKQLAEEAILWDEAIAEDIARTSTKQQ